MRIQRMIGAGVVAAALALAGCDPVSWGEVSGTVTLDGVLIESGSIQFTPVDGTTPTAGGQIKNGQFRAKVPVGLMKVSISAPKVVGKKKIYNTKDSPEMPITKEALPARYNDKTVLEFDVQPGTNSKDWELYSS